MDESLENKIKEIKEHFGELIDDDTAKILAEYILGFLNDEKILARIRGKVKDKKHFPDKGYCRIVVDSGDSDLSVYFWDDACEVALNDIYPGMIVEFEGQKGHAGYHVRDAELIKIEIDENEIKSVSEVGEGYVNVKGRVVGIEGVKETKDGRKLASFVISDGKTYLPLVLWDDKVEFAEIISPGDELIIFNAYVNEYKGRRNIHAGRKAFIDVKHFQ